MSPIRVAPAVRPTPSGSSNSSTKRGLRRSLSSMKLTGPLAAGPASCRFFADGFPFSAKNLFAVGKKHLPGSDQPLVFEHGFDAKGALVLGAALLDSEWAFSRKPLADFPFHR